MTESQRLLAEYAQTGSEAAFLELVARYVDLVYSAAVRLVNGDAHRAQDVTQAVFVDLARKAATLSREVMLGGWLHRHTCYVAANVMRGERRRQHRERLAVEMNALEDHSEANLKQVAPILDEAINELGAEDRTAILLRFFEQRDLRSVGEALGGSENAAQKRISRALEELRGLLKRRGVVLSTTTLGTALAAEAVSAAPAGLAAGITTTALAGAATGVGTTTTILKIMSITKLKTAAVGAVVVMGVGTSLVIQQRTDASVRATDVTMQQQAGRIAGLLSQNERLAGSGQTDNPGLNTAEELQRLQNEAAILRRQTNALAKLQEENRQLLAAAPRARSPQPVLSLQAVVQAREVSRAKKLYASDLGLAMKAFAEKNQGRQATNVNQAIPYLNEKALANTNFTTDQFDIVVQEFPDLRMENGTVNPGPPPKHTLREKQARQMPEGGWERIYVYVDSGVTTHARTADGNFEAWEKSNNMRPFN